MTFPKLNLPPFEPRLRAAAAGSAYVYEVFDQSRRKWLCLTPEEYVRQAFSAFLTGYKGVPAGLLANEVSLSVNGMERRSDTVVFGRDRRPLMIVEYKRPTVEITQEVFSQIARYNITLQAPFLAVSNGLSTYCVQFEHSSGTYRFLESFPTYDEMVVMAGAADDALDEGRK